MMDVFGLLELKTLIEIEPKRCINTIKGVEDCKICYNICPARAIDLKSLLIDTSSCTLCGACFSNCPTQSINLHIDHVSFINSLEQDQISIGCIKSDKAEVLMPCLMNLSLKDILNISKTKTLYFDINPCGSCKYNFAKDIKSYISKAIYLSKIFRLKTPSFTHEDFNPRFRKTSFKQLHEIKDFEIKSDELCQNQIPFEGAFGVIEISSGCDLCGACEVICPQKAIKIENGTIKFSHGLCIACSLCEYACAISHQNPPLSLKKAIIPSKFNKNFENISISSKHTCEHCGKTFYSKDENQKLCLYCQKEENINNMMLNFLGINSC